MHTHTRFSTRTVAFGVAAVLALVPASCGDSDDDTTGGATAADQGQATGSDQQQIRAVFRDVQRAYSDGNPKVICDRLNAAAQAELATLGGKSASCVKAAGMLTEASQGLDQKPTRVLGVKVDGDTAVARVSDGGRAPVNMKMVKEDGQWKLTSLASSGGG